MIFSVETPLTEFQNDIADVVRIFYGEGCIAEDGAGAEAFLRHTHVETESLWSETFTLDTDGKHLTEHLEETPCVGTDVEKKRKLKRLIKRCVYALMKRFTGRQPEWGSMTGIRPTRLYYQQLELCKNRAQARQNVREIFDLTEEKLSLLDEVLNSQKEYITDDRKLCDLYVGIPFCTTRCSYCSFSSGEIGDGRLVEPYLSALFHEIEESRKLADELGLKIRNAYIGGGTPSSLSASQMDRLLTLLDRVYGSFDELTVEAGRPDTLNKDKLRILKEHPVSRISINPQTMNDVTLERIGRKHTSLQTEECYRMAREMGFDDINMDIIAALPGENMEMFRYTLDCILQMHPDSLTVHTLAIKRSSRLHAEHYLADQTETSQMVRAGREAAHQMGMSAYYLYRQKYMSDNLENVGYSLPEKRCRYNIDNMEETTSVLALGAGGISKCVLGKDKKILRAPNVANIEQYIARTDEMIARKKMVFQNLNSSGGDCIDQE